MPIVVNVMNFAKAATGEASLFSLDDARTLFHEFGHALHGMLSDVTYPRISGTQCRRAISSSFPRSSIEHWIEQPEMLRRFALHYETGEPMPEALIEQASRSAPVQPGLRDGRIYRLGAGRPRSCIS